MRLRVGRNNCGESWDLELFPYALSPSLIISDIRVRDLMQKEELTLFSPDDSYEYRSLTFAVEKLVAWHQRLQE